CRADQEGTRADYAARGCLSQANGRREADQRPDTAVTERRLPRSQPGEIFRVTHPQEIRPMYIRTYTGLGDPFAPLPAPARADWRRRMMPDPPAKTLLVFRRIGPFAVDKSVLTIDLKRQVAQVVDFVRSRANTMQAIGVIRIVGHTD